MVLLVAHLMQNGLGSQQGVVWSHKGGQEG